MRWNGLLYNTKNWYKEYYGGVYLHISSLRRLCLGINEGTLGNITYIYAAILLVSEDYSKSFFFIFCSQHKKA